MENDGLVGMIIPDHANAFFSLLAQRIQREITESGLALVVMSSDGSRARELSALLTLFDLDIRGLIFISAGDNPSALDLISGRALPVLVLDREVPGVPNCDFVVTDNELGEKLALRHLVEFGHRRIGCIKGSMSTVPGRERFRGFKRECEVLEIEPDESLIFSGDFKFGSGTSVGKSLAKMDAAARPTGIVVGNDLMAIGLIQSLADGGICVPDEISVIGYDNIPLSGWIVPRLSTVAQDIQEIAGSTVRFLVDRVVRGASSDLVIPPRVEVIRPSLILRQSTMRLN
jgi:LacI family transcriptional regulator